MEAPDDTYVEALSRLALFADLTRPQLEVDAHSFVEEEHRPVCASTARPRAPDP